jgi:tetratricopeptide (TPR) repeat protein
MIERSSLKYVVDALVSKDRHEQAKELLEFFEQQAKTAEDLDTLGECSIRAQHYELRLRCAKKLYSLCTTAEQLFNARENLYKVYSAMNYPEKALFYIDLNLKLKPNDTETLLNRAFNLALMNKKPEGEAILNTIKTDDPKHIKSLNFARVGKMLREGDTARGISNFITAFKPKNHLFEDTLKLKFWDGVIQPGKTIVIAGEGGVGDEIINIRFLKNLKDLGMNPILYSSWHMYRPDTVDLFRRNGFNVTTNHLFFKNDYLWTHLMSLPGYLGLTEDQLWTGPYLTALRQEKNRLNDDNFKIGIKCSGNPYFEQDIYRKIPIDQFLDYLPKKASIYYIDTAVEVEGINNLKNRIKSWDDTLDFIDQMDVIVSSCTSLVHAAGAMGKRTIAVVPISEYYVWTSSRENTPWYGDNFTLLKQTELRCWKDPLEKVKKLLC